MKKFVFKVLQNWVGYVKAIFRSNIFRRIIRNIEWIKKKERTLVYGGVPFYVVYNQIFNKKYRKEEGKDVVKCFLRYGVTPKDYVLLGFDSINKTKEQRKSFVTDLEKDAWLIKKEGWNNYLELSDKYGFFKKAQAFFYRQICAVNSSTSLEQFVSFVLKVKDLFVKPNDSSYGYGAFIEYVDTEEKASTLFEKLKASGGSWIVEERIHQDEEMSKWNESSVNTVRFTDCLTKEGFFPLTPVLRTGRSGSIVDNGGSGGILANIDLQTGKVYTDGINEEGVVYENHPDSGIKFKGAQIPKWEELVKTAEKVHRTVFPNHFYVGWDFAYADGKWVLIEGNWGQFLNQYVDKIGRKIEFLNYLSK